MGKRLISGIRWLRTAFGLKKILIPVCVISILGAFLAGEALAQKPEASITSEEALIIAWKDMVHADRITCEYKEEENLYYVTIFWIWSPTEDAAKWKEKMEKWRECWQKSKEEQEKYWEEKWARHWKEWKDFFGKKPPKSEVKPRIFY